MSFLDVVDEPRIFMRNGKQCYFDNATKKLRIITPEETVRQKLIAYMNKVMKVPIEAIDVEVPISRFVHGVKGRMDLIVFGLSNEHRTLLLVVECKAPNVLLTDDVFQQADKYVEVVNAPFVGVTNGYEFIIDHWNGKEYKRVEGVPNYSELCDPINLKMIDITPMKYTRLDFSTLDSDDIYNMAIREYIIGVLTPRMYVPFIMNLHDCIMDDSVICDSIDINGYESVTDMGKRFTRFSNASGGGYDGIYRYFLLKDLDGDTQIASIGVFSYSERHSIILVAIDDYDTHNSALQLNIELNVTLNENYVNVWHNGRMTVGNIGAIRSAEVIRFIAEKSERLVKNGKVFLGRLDNSKRFYMDSIEIAEFLSKIIEYAFLRNEFRDIIKLRKR